MQIIKENKGQGSAELILIFGGIIVIAIIAAVYYRSYLSGLGNASSSDVQNVNNNLTQLKNKF
ncbi:MAG: class III signal peptide-containing protein [Methanobacterium sp.]